VSRATIQDWERLFAACDHATFFHSPAWSRIWEEYTQGQFEPAPKKVVFADGAVAVIGITRRKATLAGGRDYLSPGSTYGGWVSQSRLTADQTAELSRIVMHRPSIVWRRSPFDETALSQDIAGADMDSTHVIDLREGADDAQGRWRSPAARLVRGAKRRGLHVRQASSVQDWLSYDRIYRESLKRWGSASMTYETRLFEVLAELDDPRVRLYLAESADGSAVAGALLLVANRHAAYWHGASVSEGRSGAANLLFWELIAELAAETIDVLDLCPSGGHEGVIRFKETLGAVPRPSPIVIKISSRERLDRALRAAKSRLARR
jgi:hypothetical protein